MKYYLIAGEASGDLHGSNLIKALYQLDPNAQMRCWGGDLMQQAGAELVKHYRDTAYMGFVEVLKHLPDIWRNLRFCKQDIVQFQPDALILIDYPGFNLRIAPFAKQQQYRVFYYISPQVWAWKAGRIPLMQQSIDILYAILPFEQIFYQQHGWNDVVFVGHPLLDAIEQTISEQKKEVSTQPLTAESKEVPIQALTAESKGVSIKPLILELFADQLETTSHQADILNETAYQPDSRQVIALLPGSRKQEIRRMLPIMLQTTDLLGKEYHYIIAGAPSISPEFYLPLLRNYPNVSLAMNQTYSILQQATAAIVTSGTATLETALWNVPQVVVYSGNYISYQIAKRLIKVRYISLVNLILNEETVVELIQNNFTPQQTADAMRSILPSGNGREVLLAAYAQLRQQLGGAGASARTAKGIFETIVKKS